MRGPRGRSGRSLAAAVAGAADVDRAVRAGVLAHAARADARLPRAEQGPPAELGHAEAGQHEQPEEDVERMPDHSSSSLLLEETGAWSLSAQRCVSKLAERSAVSTGGTSSATSPM